MLQAVQCCRFQVGVFNISLECPLVKSAVQATERASKKVVPRSSRICCFSPDLHPRMAPTVLCPIEWSKAERGAALGVVDEHCDQGFFGEVSSESAPAITVSLECRQFRQGR